MKGLAMLRPQGATQACIWLPHQLEICCFSLLCALPAVLMSSLQYVTCSLKWYEQVTVEHSFVVPRRSGPYCPSKYFYCRLQWLALDHHGDFVRPLHH